jgi:hypothetical protein
MFKEVFHHLNLNHLGIAALLLFLGSFLAMTVWAFTRSRQEVDQWSSLPLEPAPIPVETNPRTAAPQEELS